MRHYWAKENSMKLLSRMSGSYVISILHTTMISNVKSIKRVITQTKTVVERRKNDVDLLSSGSLDCFLKIFFKKLWVMADRCFWQIRNALEKERESTDRERARHQAKLEEIRDKYESALKQVREELEAERQGHHHLNASVNKIKKVGGRKSSITASNQSHLCWHIMIGVSHFWGSKN